MWRFLLWGGVGLLLLSAALGWWGWRGVTAPYGEVTTLYVVEPGATTRGVARDLAELGLVRGEGWYVWATRLEGLGGRLKVGEYEASGLLGARGLARLLSSGKSSALRRLTIPEGLTSREVVDLVRGAGGLTGEVRWAPEEGSVLPDTYLYAYGYRRHELLRDMERAMDEALKRAWEGRLEDLPLESKREALILASMVEKETGLAAERGLVAGVFVNRLRRGMKLQSDPTAAYGITEGKRDLGRALRGSDLRARNGYNTYVVSGLPEGAIANPGRGSLEAATRPTETKYVYFVADGEGGHVFAETLKEHNRNVREWRRKVGR